MGQRGIQGERGNQGLQGTSGSEGFQGVQGSLGFQGIQGNIGEGIQGFEGIQGETGTQGSEGEGVQGVQGISGTGGTAGDSQIINVYDNSVQSTTMLVPIVDGQGATSPLFATKGPNPSGATINNLVYEPSISRMTMENLVLGGNLVVEPGGTITGVLANEFFNATNSATKTSGVLKFNDNVSIRFGNGDDMEMSSDGAAFNMNHKNQGSIFVKANGSTKFTLNTSNGDFTADGDITSNSDIRLKQNVITIDSALDKVLNLRGVYFDMISNPDRRRIGFIAQEVEAVAPELVKEGDTEEKIKSVSYGNLTALLVESIKELKHEIDMLKVM